MGKGHLSEGFLARSLLRPPLRGVCAPRAAVASPLRAVLLPTVVGLLLLAAPAFAITGTNNPTTLANAALRDPSLLTSAVFDVAANANATAVATENVAGFPEQGSDYLVLSSGNATLAPNASQAPLASVNNAGGTRGSAQNVVALRLNLNVPAGANCVSLKFRFFSDEYPTYVGQGFNDGFLAEMDPSTPWTMSNHQITAPDNFAFMPGGAFVSINSAPMTAANAVGTVYGGGTQPLSASTAVTPGAHSLVLSVWDDGDTSYDSAAFVDDIRAFTAGPGGCAEGSVVTPVDNVPPDTTITADPGAGSGSATSFSFTASEAGSSFECRLDGRVLGPCPSPKRSAGLSAGSHTFEVRATMPPQRRPHARISYLDRGHHHRGHNALRRPIGHHPGHIRRLRPRLRRPGRDLRMPTRSRPLDPVHVPGQLHRPGRGRPHLLRPGDQRARQRRPHSGHPVVDRGHHSARNVHRHRTVGPHLR